MYQYTNNLTLISGAGDVWIMLRNTTYQNNSNVILEDIGDEVDDALLCITNQTACCRPPYSGDMGAALGNWYFPNGTVVFSTGVHSDIYRTRGQMVVRMHRKRGGEEGIYRCEIPDAMNFTQTIYIGVYSISTGELHNFTKEHLTCLSKRMVGIVLIKFFCL